MGGLRRGEFDFLFGALRDPPPIGDVEQEALFDDTLVMVARKAHPLMQTLKIVLADVARYPLIVATEGTPTRAAFDRLFHDARLTPASLVETGSMILMRELLRRSDHIGCISRLQVQAELQSGAIVELPTPLLQTTRPIGITRRSGWVATKAQTEFLDDLKTALHEDPDICPDEGVDPAPKWLSIAR